MKRVSLKQQKRLRKYKKLFDQDDLVQTCALCGNKGTKFTLQRHHPWRRLGDNLYKYEYVDAEPCHREIEEGKHPEHLPRDENEYEKRMNNLKPGDNMLKQ